MPIQDQEYKALRHSLLNWFQVHKRDLPFRVKPTAYKVWVSEVMLQQTRVKAMLPLYDQFLLRFPNMESLAEASEEELLKYWSGLGYYSRARNLRKACLYVLSRYNGRFPDSLEEALSIPGVGPYTARAILSIAYDRVFAVLDGNVKRIVSRFFAEKNEKKWQNLADQFLNSEKPGDHNQAMMELGALVCLPVPKCGECPIQSGCKARKEGSIGSFPPTSKEKEKVSIQLHFYLFTRDSKILLVKDKNRRFFKDIFSLPYVIQPSAQGQVLSNQYLTPQYVWEWIDDLGTTVLSGSSNHNITHHNIELFLHRSNRDLSANHHIIHGAEEMWTDWENLKNDFPSSISKKIMNFPGVGGLFPT